MTHIDGDFISGKGNCEYHCRPSCHPGQTGKKIRYGCTHPAWPSNRFNDFVPLVECGGKTGKCELKDHKFAKWYRRGLAQRLKNAQAKVAKLDAELAEIDKLLAK